jgi:hypothetical protein
VRAFLRFSYSGLRRSKTLVDLQMVSCASVNSCELVNAMLRMLRLVRMRQLWLHGLT